MKRKYFFGKYYKFVLKDGFTFAVIDYIANNKKGLQLITKDHSYQIEDLDSIRFENDKITFNVKEENISLLGIIGLVDLHPLKYKAMGPFSLFSMECSHDIYSMYHHLKGELIINGEIHSLEGGYGYIEGDKGKSFPTKYLWYNSVGNDYGVTLAIATIPFGLINFTGLLCFINIKGKEYRLCTYNSAKIKSRTKDKIIIQKGKYLLELNILEVGGKDLKAPTLGEMNRIIKENVAVKTSFTFKYKNKILLEKEDNYSSLEVMM